MIAGSPGIRLDATPALQLRPGETVLLTAIRRLAGDRWAVCLRGQVLVARSAAGLAPGRVIRARVAEAGDQVVLSPVRRLLGRAGLPADGVSERIVTALLRSGFAPDPGWVGRIRRLLAGRESVDSRLIRLITLLLDKKIDPHSPGFERVLSLLGDGRGGQRQEREDGRREREREREPGGALLVRLLKERIDRGEGDAATPFLLLNHLAAGHQDWIIIPYRLSGRGVTLAGFLRILYDPHLKEARRLVVECREEGGVEWAFVLTPAGRQSFLNAFCSDPDVRRRGWAGPADLKTKLQNIGIEVDDTIGEYRDFDGFSLPEEGPRVSEVDTWR